MGIKNYLQKKINNILERKNTLKNPTLINNTYVKGGIPQKEDREKSMLE